MSEHEIRETAAGESRRDRGDNYECLVHDSYLAARSDTSRNRTAAPSDYTVVGQPASRAIRPPASLSGSWLLALG
jgi:hypothetical protein